MMALRVTAKWLAKMDACEEQVELFEAVFPRGAAVTLKNLRKAEDAGLNLYWLACANWPVPQYALTAAEKADNMVGSPEDIMVIFKAMMKRGRKKLG